MKLEASKTATAVWEGKNIDRLYATAKREHAPRAEKTGAAPITWSGNGEFGVTHLRVLYTVEHVLQDVLSQHTAEL